MTQEDPLAMPCPCGSGRTFGDCCGSPSEASPSSKSQSVLEEVKRNLEGQSFDSEKDLQQALEQQLSVHNQQPQSDFHGLSPDQMYRLLYQPFESPELIQFGEGVRGRPPALIAGLFEVIAEEAYDQPGIKLTDRGNLPRSVVNRAKDMLDPEELA